jgi:hypothetical protein
MRRWGIVCWGGFDHTLPIEAKHLAVSFEGNGIDWHFARQKPFPGALRDARCQDPGFVPGGTQQLARRSQPPKIIHRPAFFEAGLFDVVVSGGRSSERNHDDVLTVYENYPPYVNWKMAIAQTSQPSDNPPVNPVAPDQTLVVGLSPVLPFVIKSNSAQSGSDWDGIGVQLWREIRPDQAIAQLQTGNLDVVLMTATAPRGQRVDFTQSYFATTLGIATKRQQRFWEVKNPFYRLIRIEFQNAINSNQDGVTLSL